MPWARIDDTFHDHPKTQGMLGERGGIAAVGLLTLLLSYCNRHLTDGCFSETVARRLGGTDAMLAHLTRHGFVDRAGEGYRIHDFLAYSKSREKVESERAAWKDRQRRARGGHDDVTP